MNELIEISPLGRLLSILPVALGLLIGLLLSLQFFLKIRLTKAERNLKIYSSREEKKEEETVVARVEAEKAELDPDKIVGPTKNLSKAIVSIISHMDSKGALSVCINGAWGSGKSTLINHAISILRRRNCTCVIFNAWHHESEHHLYAALIEQIRKSWIPRKKLSYPYIESSEQIKFSERFFRFLIRYFDCIIIYLHLWISRFVKAWVQITLFLILLLVSFLGFWYLLLIGILTFICGTDIQNVELFGLNFETLDSDSSYSHLYFLFLLMCFAIWIYFWYSPYNSLKAFPAAPVSQVSARTPWLTFAQFAEQLSFRYRFSISFNEVCKALNSRNRRLVIIIDDIDRCNTDQILELLEAVNFLCTSGSCFVLLAMDKERVIEMLITMRNIFENS